jgi:hypothetical protein
MAGPKAKGAELTVIAETVEDGKVTVVGPEIDEVEVGSTIPFGVLVEVSESIFFDEIGNIPIETQLISARTRGAANRTMGRISPRSVANSSRTLFLTFLSPPAMR